MTRDSLERHLKMRSRCHQRALWWALGDLGLDLAVMQLCTQLYGRHSSEPGKLWEVSSSGDPGFLPPESL